MEPQRTMLRTVMLTDGQSEWAAERDLQLAPVRHHVANVQLIGIARLRYRPPWPS